MLLVRTVDAGATSVPCAPRETPLPWLYQGCLVDNPCFMRANCIGNTSVYRTEHVRPLIDNASVMCGTSLITIRNYRDYHLYTRFETLCQESGHKTDASLANLQDAFLLALRKPSKPLIYIVVDALDKC